MATYIGNASECKKKIKELLKKVEKGKYKINNIIIRTEIETDESVKEEDGHLYLVHEKGHHDTFTINYIDKD